MDLEFTPEALSAIAKQALERKIGARGLRSIVENALLDSMFEIPSTTDVAKVVVDEKVITDKQKPAFIAAAAVKEA